MLDFWFKIVYNTYKDFISIIYIILLNYKKLKNLNESLSEGAKNSFLPLLNSSAIVGYGSIIKALPIFAVFGMLPAQYTYFVTIKYSNAGTATVLQYTGPVLIVLYMALRQKRVPTKTECLAVLCALFGIFLLATNGNLHSFRKCC